MLQLFRALAVFAITTVLVGRIASAQTPPSVFSPGPFVDRGAEKSRVKLAKNGPAAKNKLGHKKLKCDAEIDS